MCLESQEDIEIDHLAVKLDLPLGLCLARNGIVYSHYLEMYVLLDEDLNPSRVRGKIIQDIDKVLKISQLLVLL